MMTSDLGSSQQGSLANPKKAHSGRQGRVSRDSLVLYISIFVMGGCGLAYEYTFSKLSSDLLGHSIRQWAIIIGVMMFFMGVGSDVQKRIKDAHLIPTFILGEVVLALLGAFGPIAMLWAYGQFFSHYVLVQYFFVGMIGLLIGFEIPLLTRINASFNGDLKLNLGSMLRMDYMGSLAGALAWVFILPQLFSVIEMAFVLGLLTMASACAGLVFFYRRLNKPHQLACATLTALSLIIGGFHYAGDWEVKGQQFLYQDKIVFAATSPYQHIVVTQSKSDDTALYINGHLQFSSIDEHIYHENLVHPAMQVSQHHDRVLILGGGDGIAAREVLKYTDVRELTLVDLDPMVTQLAQTNPYFLKINQGSLNQAKTHVIDNHALVPSESYQVYSESRQKGGYPKTYEPSGTFKILNIDALKFLEQVNGLYDVIIVDFPDPNAPELAKLYSKMFYHQLARRLAPGGIFVQQSTSPFWAKEAFLNIGRTIKSSGFVALPYHDNVPSFGEWGFWLAARADQYQELELRSRIEAINHFSVATRYLTPAVVKASFVFGLDDLKSENTDVNTILSSKLHDYYLQGWRKTF